MERPVLQGIKFCEKIFCHDLVLSGRDTLNNPMLEGSNTTSKLSVKWG
jgi:hypothetical protein